MSIKVLGTYAVGNYTSIVYPDGKCTICPFFQDSEVSWCGWYKERIGDINFNRDCRIKKIEVEEK